MSNLLYHNDRSVFYLSDGVNVIEIKEPVGWDVILLSVEFEPTTGTYRVEFTDKELTLKFDESAGRSFIDNIYETKGPDGICYFEYGILSPADVFTSLYKAQTVLTNWDTDKVYSTLSLERVSIADKFLTNFSKKVPIESEKSLFGTSLSPIPVQSLRLHTARIFKTTVMTYNPNFKKLEDVDQRLVDGYQFSGWDFDINTVPPGTLIRDAVPPFIIKSTSIDGLQTPITPDGTLLYSGLNLPFGVLKRVITFEWDITPQFAGDWVTIFTAWQDMRLGFKIYKKSGIAIPGNDATMDGNYTAELGSEISAQDAAASFALDPDYLGGQKGYRTVNFKGTGTITLFDDEAIFVKIYIRRTPAMIEFGNYLRIISDYVNQPQTFLKVKEETYFTTTKTNCFSLKDAISRQVEIITDKVGIFKSDFLTRGSGCAGNHLLMSGKMIRGNEMSIVNTDKAGKASFSAQDWYRSLNMLFNIGVNVERDNDDNEKIVVEPIEYFFRDVELYDLVDNVSKYRKYCDPSVVSNAISIGFSKFPQDQEDQSLDEWMSKMEFQTPIVNNNDKYERVCDWLLSTYYIEYTRRQSFIEDPTKAYETDNNIFLINDTGVLVSSFSPALGGGQFSVNPLDPEQKNFIYLPLSGNTGIVTGDTIVVSGTVSNNRSFTVTIVDEEAESLADSTRIYVSEPVVEETKLNFTISFSPRYLAKKDEDFATVTGIGSPSTAYNLIHHIRRILLRHAKSFRQGMIQKSDLEKIFYTSGGNNSSLETELLQSVLCRFGDNFPEGIKVSDGSDGANSSLQHMDQPIHTQNIIECTSNLNWTIIQGIRKAFEGRHPDDLDYGYISLRNPKGIKEKGHILSMKWNPNTCQVNFKLREKHELI